MDVHLNKYANHLLLVVLVYALSGCSNLESISQAPPEKGIPLYFSGDHELIKSAVLAAMQNLNIHIKDSYQSDDGFNILFTKAITAVSWGEVGRVVVLESEPSKTVAYVHSQGRVKAQLFGVKEHQFARMIDNGVTKILADSNL